MYKMLEELDKRREAKVSDAPVQASPVDNYLLLGAAVNYFPFDEKPARSRQYVPIASAASQPAVPPSRKTLASGAYPLRVNWRIIVRPDASKLAKGTVHSCVIALSNSVNPAEEWLMPADRSEQPDTVRMFYYGGRDAFVTAAEQYAKEHPAIRIADVPAAGMAKAMIGYRAEAPLANLADLLIVIGNLFPDQRAKLVKACGGRVG
jgi:hypothetical protein